MNKKSKAVEKCRTVWGICFQSQKKRRSAKDRFVERSRQQELDLSFRIVGRLLS